jgi:hypothetical protein
VHFDLNSTIPVQIRDTVTANIYHTDPNQPRSKLLTFLETQMSLHNNRASAWLPICYYIVTWHNWMSSPNTQMFIVVSSKSILKLSYYLRLPGSLIMSRFPTKMLYLFLFSPIRSTCSVNVISGNVTIREIRIIIKWHCKRLFINAGSAVATETTQTSSYKPDSWNGCSINKLTMLTVVHISKYS